MAESISPDESIDESIRQALENTPDEYEFRGILGGGWFGIVYLVYSRKHRRFFALKMLNKKFRDDIDGEESFRKEANIWIGLGKHPYFAHVYWVDEIAGRLCIVMECLPKNEAGSISLDDYLKDTPLDIAQILRWAIQFCYAMAYAYSKEITCHRDIKPTNILIGPNGDVQITDFGLGDSSGAAKPEIAPKITTEDLTKPQIEPKTNGLQSWGYQTHMPPEWWSDDSVCNQRLDIYSFGITLFQMINKGDPPFVGDSREEYDALHRYGQIPQIASPLFPIIERCLEKSPNERYQTFDELRSDLEDLLQPRPGEVIAAPILREMEFWEWNNKGRSRIHLKHFDDALLDFDKALEGCLEACPVLTEAWGGKGICYHVLASVAANEGHTEAAHQYRKQACLAFDNATLFDFNNLQAWFNWGNLYSTFREDVQALECYDWAIQINPLYAAVWINKADCEFALSESDPGRQEDAKKSYKRFKELADPAQYQSQIDHANEMLQKLTKKAVNL